jgi:hypothetical protein
LQVRQLRDIGAKYKPDLVIQCIDMTDFRNDLVYDNQLAESGYFDPKRITIFDAIHVKGSRTLFDVPNYSNWIAERLPPDLFDSISRIPAHRFFAMGQPLDESRPFLETTWQAILETHDEAQKLKAGFMVIVLPRYQQYNPSECPNDWEAGDFPKSDEYFGEPFRYFSEKATTVSFPIHSLLEPFQKTDISPLCFASDPHWNEKGHRIAAQEMAKHIATGFTGKNGSL